MKILSKVLRWLAPLPVDAVVEACADCSMILVVDECRQTGSLSEQLVTELAERGRHASRRRNTNPKSRPSRPTKAHPPK